MSKTRIPSPARSQGPPTTPRRNPRGSRSVGSPARSNASGRLTTLIQDCQDNNLDSFALSPLYSVQSFLGDNTDIDKPRRTSWWKKLEDSSRDVMEGLQNNDAVVKNPFEELEVSMLSLESKNYTLDLPESSDSESISSIVIPQRKLFTQNDNQQKNKYWQLKHRESVPILHKTSTENEKSINPAPKKLFAQGNKTKRNPIFPAEMLKISRSKTPNKTKENVQTEVQVPVRSLFGNRASMKRKNIFTDFILPESEDEEMTVIQPSVFGFHKKAKQDARKKGTDFVSSASDGSRGLSPTNSITRLEMSGDWNLLPSSTMVQEMEVDDDNRDNLGILPYSDDESGNNKIERNIIIRNSSNIPQDLQRQHEKDIEYDMDEEVISKIIIKSNKIRDENQQLENDEQLEHGKEKDDDENVKLDEANRKLNKDMEEPVHENLDIRNMSNKLNYRQNIECIERTEQKHDKASELDVTREEADKNYEIEINAKEVDNVSKEQHNNIQDESDHENDKKIDEVIEEPKDKNRDIQNMSRKGLNENQETENKEQSEEEHKDKNRIQNKSKGICNNSHRSQNEEQDEDPKIEKDMVESGGEKRDIENISGKVLNECLGTVNQVQSEDNENAPEFNDENEEQAGESQEIQNKPEGAPNISLQSLTEEQKEDNHENTLKLGENIEESKDKNSDIQNITEECHDEIQDQSEDEDEMTLKFDDENEEQDGENEIQNKTEGVRNIRLQSQNEEQDKNNHEGDLMLDENIEESEDENRDIQNMTEEVLDESQEIGNEEHSEDEDENAPEFEDEMEQQEDENIQNESKDVSQMSLNEQQDEEYPELDDDIAEPEDEYADTQNESQERQEEEIDRESDIDDQEDEIDEQDNNQETQQNTTGNEDAQIESDEDENVNNDEGDDITQETSKDHVHNIRNKKKDNSIVKSPEAAAHGVSHQINSFTVHSRNTSIRKTKSIIKDHSLSLAPPRESTGFSDGVSSAEGSVWDSHRVTRKTLRQTFGKDFTPRKSLRALVMEKSAKRYTTFNDVNMDTIDMPRANSTEYPNVSNRHDDVENEENAKIIPKKMSLASLERYLQEKKKENMEKRNKMKEDLRYTLRIPEHDTAHLYRMPARPTMMKQANKTTTQNKPKNKKTKTMILLGEMPEELLEDLKYKPPKRYKPHSVGWVTNRLYKYLETKLEPKYDYKARVRAEKLVETIYEFTKITRRHHVAPADSVETLKHEMARLNIVKTHHEFYGFIHEFMPREVRIKVVPDIVNKIPLPRHGPFSDILGDGQGLREY